MCRVTVECRAWLTFCHRKLGTTTVYRDDFRTIVLLSVLRFFMGIINNDMCVYVYVSLFVVSFNLAVVKLSATKTQLRVYDKRHLPYDRIPKISGVTKVGDTRGGN